MAASDDPVRGETEQHLDLLRRATLRAIVAARGRDPRVDQALDELRIRVHGGPEKLEQSLVNLSDAIAQMDDDAPPASEPGQPVRRRWLDRLLPVGRDEADEAVSRAPSGFLVEQVREGLLRILMHLSLPREFGLQVRELQCELAGELGADSLAGCVNRFAELVIAAHKAESREMKDFLRQLTLRLDDLNNALAGQEGIDDQRLDDSASINSAIQENVGGIRRSLESGGDLRDLREAIAGRLDAMTTQMNRYHELQEQRHAESRASLRRLRDALAAAEQQSGELRDTLDKERTQALQDQLTGLPNRQAYDERLEMEVARWRRTGSPLSLMIGDIDHFKALNDRHGHQAGDKALREVAQCLRGQLRAEDFLARYGGEEFVVLLPAVALQHAAMVAEKLRYELEKKAIRVEPEDDPVTISFGVAAFGGDEDSDSVFRRADRALYRAKRVGRNRVVRLMSEHDRQGV